MNRSRSTWRSSAAAPWHQRTDVRCGRACLGQQAVVELSALIGYFAMVCWIMNVAHTPAQGEGPGGLAAFPL
jgi:hypothetical protein